MPDSFCAFLKSAVTELSLRMIMDIRFNLSPLSFVESFGYSLLPARRVTLEMHDGSYQNAVAANLV